MSTSIDAALAALTTLPDERDSRAIARRHADEIRQAFAALLARAEQAERELAELRDK